MTARHEQRFIAATDALEFSDYDISHALSLLKGWLQKLTDDIATATLPDTGLNKDSPLAHDIQAFNTSLHQNIINWSQQWIDLAPAQELATTFDDKIMLLVFGKFNAGKSSFCNFLAERLAAQRPPTYFRVNEGRVVETHDIFQEGTTETTAQLQGVILGQTLVLLDTPGLHSVTPENADLTRRFTDSADGILWLTSSTSPGQVQELDELSRELHRNKPLLPVVTRSDIIDEDEVNGKIQKVLCNKSPENRREQEQDVQIRAREKLVSMGADPSLLKPPVSLSTHVARHQGQDARAMEDAGFERLYAALLDMIEPALQYKQRKPAEMLLHHLEEVVLHALHAEIHPGLKTLITTLESEQDALEDKKQQAVRTVWRDVIPALPKLLEQYASDRSGATIANTVTQWLHSSTEHALDKKMANYGINLDTSVTIPKHHLIGLNFAERHDALLTAIREALEKLADDALAQCQRHIIDIELTIERLQVRIKAQEQRLKDIKKQVRENPALD